MRDADEDTEQVSAQIRVVDERTRQTQQAASQISRAADALSEQATALRVRVQDTLIKLSA